MSGKGWQKQIDRLRFAATQPGNFARLMFATASNRIHHLTMSWGPRRVRCVLCGWEGRRFDYFLERSHVTENSQCPRCASQPRNRRLAEYLEREFELDGRWVLETSPVASGQAWFRSKGARYFSIDLGQRRAMIRMDLTRLAFADHSFDLIVCSHVLEHVPDYRAALRELHRALKLGGVALIDVPFSRDPVSRRLETPDHQGHVHVFGRDFPDSIAGAGFEVEAALYSKASDPEDPRNRFFVARRPG